MSSAGASASRGCSGRPKLTVVRARRSRPRPFGITSALPATWTGTIGTRRRQRQLRHAGVVALRARAARALREEQNVPALAQVRRRARQAPALAATAIEGERVDPQARHQRAAAAAVEAVARGPHDGARPPRPRQGEQHQRRVDVALVVGGEQRRLRRVHEVGRADHARPRDHARGREEQAELEDLAHV